MPKPHNTETARDRAVVLGAGMAGLLAARVLADHYAEVVVIDRDDLAGTGEAARRGVPQGRHLHGLLARGHDLLEQLFPGLTAELVAAGVPHGDMLADTRLCFGGHRFARGDAGLRMLCATRPALEGAVRRRVAARGPVRLLGGCDVVGLVAHGSPGQVSGVRLIRRADGSAEEIWESDLVVDATGRGSRLPTWLEPLGYQQPAAEVVRVGVGYVSRCYRLRPGALGEDLAAICAPTPDHPRGGAISRVDEERHLVTLMGMVGDHPPTDPDGFAGFAADFALDDLPRALAGATPLSSPVAHHHPTSIRHRYDRLAALPRGLVAIGDAVCGLNPIYGQGMTVAAMEAAILDEQLRRGALDPVRFQRRIGAVSGIAWALASGADLAFPAVVGRRSPMTRLLTTHVDRVQAGAAVDPAIGRAFLRVTSMVDPPGALLRPGLVARSWASGSGMARRRSGRGSPAEPDTGHRAAEVG